MRGGDVTGRFPGSRWELGYFRTRSMGPNDYRRLPARPAQWACVRRDLRALGTPASAQAGDAPWQPARRPRPNIALPQCPSPTSGRPPSGRSFFFPQDCGRRDRKQASGTANNPVSEAGRSADSFRVSAAASGSEGRAGAERCEAARRNCCNGPGALRRRAASVPAPGNPD